MVVRLHIPILFLALIVLLFAGCRSSNNAQGPEISLNFGFDPPTIDPLLATDPPTIQVDNLLFLNLTTLNEAGGVPQPGLATGWQVSADAKTWRFQLRDDVNWVLYNPTTGRADKLRAVTAKDIVYSVQHLFDPRTQSTYAGHFAALIPNAGPFNEADPRTDPKVLDHIASLLSVRALDDYTVEFNLTRPLSAFPALTATWLGRVVPQEPIDSDGINWTDPGTILTDGPYMLESWDHNQSIVLRRNPYYFDAANVQAERLRFKMYPDPNSALDAYLSGNLDTTDPYGTIEGDALTRVNEDRTLSKDAKTLPGLCTQYIGFNTKKEPFNDVLVRRAFATAIDRDTIVSQIFKTGQVARWFTPPDVNAAPDISSTLGIDFNAPEGKSLLDQSSWSSARRQLPTLTFSVTGGDVFIQMAVSASQNWKAALGAAVQVDADDSPFSTYLDNLRKDPPAIFRLGYCAAYPDAANFAYDVFHTGADYNLAQWSNRQYDQLVEQAARETDVVRRRTLYQQAEKLLIQDQAVIIPLSWTTRVALTNAHIQRTYALMEGYDHIESWRVSR